MVNLRSKVTRELLAYFFLHEGESLYVNELVRRLGIDKRNLVKKLNELERTGLFKTEIKGILKFYFLNKMFPLYKEYKKIIMKTVGLETQFRQVLCGIKGISRAFIYGSYVADTMDAASDIDIMVIGGHKVIEVQKAVGLLQKKFDREINVINISEEEFKSKKKDPFISAIMKRERIEIL